MEDNVKEVKEEEIKDEDKLIENIRERRKEASQAMVTGKGVLRLENPFEYADEEITELEYDFTILTGMEYVDAMDMESNPNNIFRATYKQNLALFAQAAAKCTRGLDMRDIMERIGITDAQTGAMLASLFFNASTRAGQMRISKKS